MLRPSRFTSSPFEGTSGSWHNKTNERVPTGTSFQAKSGFRFSESDTRVLGSTFPNAYSGGIGSNSENAVVVSFMQAPRLLKKSC